MAGSKLEYYLGNMPKEQLKAFRLMLSRQNAQRDQVLAKLCDLILKTKLGPEGIYHRLYPGEEFAEKQIRNLRSALLERLIDFVTSSNLKSSIDRDLYWIRALQDWGVTKYSPSLLKKVDQKIGKQPEGADRYVHQSHLGMEKLHYELSTIGRRTEYYDQLLSHQEEAFVAQTLKIVLGFREKQAISGQAVEAPPLFLWLPILDAWNNGAWSDSISIQLYFAAIQLSTSPSEANLNHLVPNLISQAHLLSSSEVINLYTVAMNHCIRLWRKGIDSALLPLFNLNKKMVELEIFISNDEISPWHFKVMVNTAVQARELNWAKDFIDQYGNYLPSIGRTEFLAYCEGLIAFYAGEFTTSETWMNRALQDSNDPFLRLDARTYLLRIFYETEDDIGMESTVNTFRVQLQRYKDLPAARLGQYKEFVRLYRRLLVLKPNSETHKQSLLEQVNRFPNISARKWFLAKLEGK